MSNEDKMRGGFETYIRHSPYMFEEVYGIRRYSDDVDYIDADVQRLWQGWKACAAIKDAEIAEARKTAEYWKSEHLAGNKEIAACCLMIKEYAEQMERAAIACAHGSSQIARDILLEAIAKSEHHNSRALEKMLLEAELKGLLTDDAEHAWIKRHDEINAKLAELNNE